MSVLESSLTPRSTSPRLPPPPVRSPPPTTSSALKRTGSTASVSPRVPTQRGSTMTATVQNNSNSNAPPAGAVLVHSPRHVLPSASATHNLAIPKNNMDSDTRDIQNVSLSFHRRTVTRLLLERTHERIANHVFVRWMAFVVRRISRRRLVIHQPLPAPRFHGEEDLFLLRRRHDGSITAGLREDDEKDAQVIYSPFAPQKEEEQHGTHFSSSRAAAYAPTNLRLYETSSVTSPPTTQQPPSHPNYNNNSATSTALTGHVVPRSGSSSNGAPPHPLSQAKPISRPIPVSLPQKIDDTKISDVSRDYRTVQPQQQRTVLDTPADRKGSRYSRSRSPTAPAQEAIPVARAVALDEDDSPFHPPYEFSSLALQQQQQHPSAAAAALSSSSSSQPSSAFFSQPLPLPPPPPASSFPVVTHETSVSYFSMREGSPSTSHVMMAPPSSSHPLLYHLPARPLALSAAAGDVEERAAGRRGQQEEGPDSGALSLEASMWSPPAKAYYDPIQAAGKKTQQQKLFDTSDSAHTDEVTTKPIGSSPTYSGMMLSLQRGGTMPSSTSFPCLSNSPIRYRNSNAMMMTASKDPLLLSATSAQSNGRGVGSEEGTARRTGEGDIPRSATKQQAVGVLQTDDTREGFPLSRRRTIDLI